MSKLTDLMVRAEAARRVHLGAPHVPGPFISALLASARAERARQEIEAGRVVDLTEWRRRYRR